MDDANDTSQGASGAGTVALADLLKVLGVPEPAASTGNAIPVQGQSSAPLTGQGYALGGGGGGDAVANVGYGGLLVVGLIAAYLIFKGS